MSPQLEPGRRNSMRGSVSDDLLEGWRCLLCDTSGRALNPQSALLAHWTAEHQEADG